MAGTSDNILELINLVDSQGFKYIIAIFKPEKGGKEDSIDLYSSFNKGQFERLTEILKQAKIEKPEHIDIKNEKNIQKQNKDPKEQ
jgi:hypothetical protein